jgi:hypothetical protein
MNRTPITNAFSKKLESSEAAAALNQSQKVNHHENVEATTAN